MARTKNKIHKNTTNYPNQREVEICKDAVDYSGRSGPYMAIYLDDEFNVMHDLNTSAFKVFCYFNSNSDGYKEGLSPQKISNFTGLNISTVKRNIKELIDKGYLVQSKRKKNKYDFSIIDFDKERAEAPPPEPPLETDIYEEEDFFDDLFPPQRAGKTNTITERKEIEVRTSGLEDND